MLLKVARHCMKTSSLWVGSSQSIFKIPLKGKVTIFLCTLSNCYINIQIFNQPSTLHGVCIKFLFFSMSSKHDFYLIFLGEIQISKLYCLIKSLCWLIGAFYKYYFKFI